MGSGLELLMLPVLGEGDEDKDGEDDESSRFCGGGGEDVGVAIAIIAFACPLWYCWDEFSPSPGAKRHLDDGMEDEWEITGRRKRKKLRMNAIA